jgi:hypothetical protein
MCIRLFSFVILLGLVADCRYFEWSDDKTAAALVVEIEKAAREPGGVADFAKAAPFDWDRLYVFPPYASAEEAKRELGFSWPTIEWTGSRNSDQFVLLVFVKGKQVLSWIDFESRKGDPLDSMKGAPNGRVSGDVARQHARFRVEVRHDGMRILKLIQVERP